MKTQTMTLMPAAKGTCAICALAHKAGEPHNPVSLFYAMRFQMVHGREPTWADACAHLPAEVRLKIRYLVGELSKQRGIPDQWTEHPQPIAEPYAISDGTVVTQAPAAVVTVPMKGQG